jgi:2-dehydropantoate 2-reductase
MKIAIVGAGAMGCLFGARLKPYVPDLVLVDVWKEHIVRLKAQGLRIETNGAAETIFIAACLPKHLPFQPDLLILFTKTFQTEAALGAIRAFISEESYLMTLQNGIGHTDIIEEYFAPSRIIHGITTYPCDLVGPGHIRTKGDGYIKFMSLAGHPYKVLQAIDQLFKGAEMDSQIAPDVNTLIWEKLAFNAAMNALTAITNSTVGQLADSPQGRQLVGAVVSEAVDVAAKLELPIDHRRIEQTIDLAFREHREHKPSMLQDVVHKKKTEIEFINGAIAKKARMAGTSAPINETLYNLVKILESGYLPV